MSWSTDERFESSAQWLERMQRFVDSWGSFSSSDLSRLSREELHDLLIDGERKFKLLFSEYLKSVKSQRF